MAGAALLLAAVLAVEPARAGETEIIDVNPSPSLVSWPLSATVVLPDRFDAAKRYPVLYLLHGKDETHAHWAEAGTGAVHRIARGFPGIIVMPDQRDGFSVDWYNGGRGGDPAWMSHWFEQLIPRVHARYPIRAGRRWHAIAGASMGGYGAMILANQRPDYFGSVAAYSAPLDVQRPEAPAVTAAVGGDYDRMLGPVDGPYAEGHNPIRTLENLRHTRVLTMVGDGVPDGEVDPVSTFDPINRAALLAVGAPVEVWMGQHGEQYKAAADAAGVAVDHRARRGTHDWPYFRRHLDETLAWGVFRRVERQPKVWSYRTSRERGRAWHVRYEFAAPLEEVARFSYENGTLRGEGSGTVSVRAKRCEFTTTLPFERRCPAG